MDNKTHGDDAFREPDKKYIIYVKQLRMVIKTNTPKTEEEIIKAYEAKRRDKKDEIK